MIKTNISNQYPHHLTKYKNSNSDIFIADYTNQTRNEVLKRSVEFFNQNPPTDVNYFTIKNPTAENIGYIDFDNSSFTFANNQSRSQCECVVFPENSSEVSWILFCELKYCSNSIHNNNDLTKAIKQLYRTRYYYFQENIFVKTNISYLIASLPLQPEPFLNFSLTQNFLIKLKRKRNIILRLKNSVEILNNTNISVK